MPSHMKQKHLHPYGQNYSFGISILNILSNESSCTNEYNLEEGLFCIIFVFIIII